MKQVCITIPLNVIVQVGDDCDVESLADYIKDQINEQVNYIENDPIVEINTGNFNIDYEINI